MPQNPAFVLNVIGAGARPDMFADIAAGAPVILSPDHAFDLAVDGDGMDALAAARALPGAADFDVNLVATAARRKTLLLADMDSTTITVECMDELAQMAGVGPQIAALTEQAMRGEIPFLESFLARMAMLKGAPLTMLERVFTERVRLDSGIKNLIATMRAHGAHTMLVSGGFNFFTRRVAQAAGFHADHGNTLLHDGVALTGEIVQPIMGGATKRQILDETVAAMGITLAQALTVGDGANDAEMVRVAGQGGGLGVAYRAKPVLVTAANAIIQHNDLSALLYLQGYSNSEIVRG